MKNSFADTIPLGLVSTIFGLMGIVNVVSKPLISLLLGLLGLLISILSLRIPEQEKLDKWSTWFGMLLSVSSIAWSLINF